MDSFRKNGDCFYVELARSYALWQLNDFNDSSLAINWNGNASRCNLTPIETGAATPKRSDSKPASQKMEIKCSSMEIVRSIQRTNVFRSKCDNGGLMYIKIER
jgi:hypothetical protein